MQLVLTIAARLLLIATNVARALQEGVVWEPVTACYGTTTADYIGPVIWGYATGALIGFSGILRRRYRELKPERVHILDIR